MFRKLLIALALACVGMSVAADARPSTPTRCPEVPLPADFDPTSVASVQRAVGNGPPLLHALGKQRRKALKQMLGAGENPNVCVLGSSLLAVSAASGDLEEVRILLAHGARPDEPRDHNGGTPLLSALGLGRFDVALLLLERGASPLATTDGGTTALHELVMADARSPQGRRQQLELAAALLQRGVPVNSRVRVPGTTPLMLSAIRGDSDMVKLLLSAGADAAIADAKGNTALGFAQKRGHHEAARLLGATAPARP